MPVPAPLAEALARFGLAPACHEHPPLRTVGEAHLHWRLLLGAQVKNLFFKDSGKQLWLVVTPGDPLLDTKILAGLIGSKRLSFASAETLEAVLGVVPGAVTPLAVMNDAQRAVRTVIHAPLMAEPAVLVHPLVNTATLALAPADLVRFMTALHRAPDLVDLTPAFR